MLRKKLFTILLLSGILFVPFCAKTLAAKNQGGKAGVAIATSDWQLYNDSTAQSSLETKIDTAVIHIGKPGRLQWSIIARRGGFAVEKGKCYRVSFRLSTNASVRVKCVVGMTEEPYYSYTGFIYPSSEEPRQYTYMFVMRQETNQKSAIQFHIGGYHPGEVTISDVSIVCLGNAPKDRMYDSFKKPVAKEMRRGIQFGLEFSSPQEGAWGALFREEYFDVLRKDGRFDSIRIPVLWETHTKSEPPYTIDPEYTKRVEWAVRNSLHRGFFTIINMHWFHALEDKPEKYRAQYLATWKQIAEYYRNYPNWLYFDIMNEPHGNLDAYWNRYLVECYDLIRAISPKRMIIISGPQWANTGAISRLELPDRITKDPNVMIQFHPYDPHEFTFQGSPGNGQENIRNIRWTGTDTEKDHITGLLDGAVAWSKKNNGVKLFNGEFCTHESVPEAHGSKREDRLLWLRFMRTECEKRGIPWNYYDFSEDGCGVYNPGTGIWDEGVMRALFD